MRIYKTQQEVDADIKNNLLVVFGDVRFEFNLKTDANLQIIGDIYAEGDITTQGDITAEGRVSAEGDIYAHGDIYAWGNISTQGDIYAWGNISAGKLDAVDISFYAICFAYTKFSCRSITGRRENSKYFCLDSKVVIRGRRKNDKKVNL